MGLDATIRRRDGLPLGTLFDAERALTAAFPGITFSWTASGEAWLAAAKAQGIEFPSVLKEFYANRSAQRQADYQGDDWSVEFHLGSGEPLEHIDIVLRGESENSIPMFEQLLNDMDWAMGFPDID